MSFLPPRTPPFYPQTTVAQRPGFFERLGIGWRLTKLSLHVLGEDKELVLLPLISFTIIGLAWGIFFASLFLTVIPTGAVNAWLLVVGIAVLYFMTYFVTTFFAAAVIGAAMIRLDGGNPTVGDGLRVAAQNIGRIIGWALFSATVGLILRAIAERFGIVGRIIAGLTSLAWGVVTYLVIPSLIFEKLGPWAAVKRSGWLIKNTWGEAAGGYLTMGGIFVLLALAGLLFIIAGAMIGTLAWILIGLIAAIVYWLILALVASAAQGILVTVLYRYATTGKTVEGFPTGTAGAAF